MKRLGREIDIEKLEQQYLKLINKHQEKPKGEKPLLKEPVNTDNKTFFILPGNMLVDYDDNLFNTDMRPGIPGPWSSSERWIYQ